MKRLFLAVLLSFSLGGEAWAGGKLSGVEIQAYNNFHSEMVECLVFYGIAEEGLKNSGNKKTAAKYREIIKSLYIKTLMLTQLIGMKEEALKARMQLSTDAQLAAIGGNYINISILLDKYLEPCTVVVNDPDSRIIFWMDKARQK